LLTHQELYEMEAKLLDLGKI